MSKPFWSKDNRRKAEELIDVPFALTLTLSERTWLRNQAKEECTSENSIVRKSLKGYRNQIESK